MGRKWRFQPQKKIAFCWKRLVQVLHKYYNTVTELSIYQQLTTLIFTNAGIDQKKSSWKQM